VDRFEEFLVRLVPPAVTLARAREHGASKRADVLLLLCAEGGACFDARAALHELAGLPFLAPAVVRFFYLTGGVAGSREGLVAALRGALRGAARLHCFPRRLERELINDLQRGDGVAPFSFNRSAPDVVASVVAVGGVFYFGVEAAAGSAAARLRPGGGCAEGAPPTVCRAEHKLREALLRAPHCVAALAAARGGGAGGLALDVGAAPGGWVRALAEAPLAFSGIVAVDPGALQWDALPGCEEAAAGAAGEDGAALRALAEAPRAARARLLHLREQGGPAIARLLRAGGAGLFSAFTCDANVPTPVAAELFASALPLLLPGALVCITLKNFDRQEWAARCDAAEALVKGACVGVARMHLFANAPQEVTLVGSVRGRVS
jgi:hypothetical protein